MIIFNNILGLLGENGWSTYRLRKDKIFGESTITRLRKGEPINTTTIDIICRLCKCQPGDLMTYQED